MKTILVALVLFLGLVSALDELSYARSFAAWKQEYGVKYSTLEEEARRFAIFKQNVDYINDMNSRGLTFTLALNQFADMTNEEYRATYLGYRGVRNSTASLHIIQGGAPTSIDWRTRGVVTPVKNQAQCGSCWSFSATGSMEGAWALSKGSLVSLSEQNLVDCSTAQGNQGCNGGLMDYAFRYVISNHGIDTEASYPYEARGPLTCRYNAANKGATISSYSDIPSGSESALQDAVGSVGPVSVAIDASHSSFQFYSGGVYYEPACSPRALDHGVLAVGYGSQGGQDYWIVKNSWGANWGSQGYILMARNRNNNCGIATEASYPKV